jgi:hypothetical protein
MFDDLRGDDVRSSYPDLNKWLAVRWSLTRNGTIRTFDNAFSERCGLTNPPITVQDNWRICDKCQGLFFGGGIANSLCPAGGTHGAPARSGSGNYSLAQNIVGDPTHQENWRLCDRCQGLFYGPGIANSRCPVGGTHSGRGNYSLAQNIAADPKRQDGWRWCNRCQGLFFGATVTMSHCPATGAHSLPPQSGNYSLLHVPQKIIRPR